MGSLNKALASGGVLLLSFCPRAPGAELPSAAEIFKKCLASYDAAKTFQAQVKFTNSSSRGLSGVAIRVKGENGADGVLVRSFLSIEHVGAELTMDLNTQQIIDDGTKSWVIYPDRKQYVTGPHAHDTISGLFRRSLENTQRIAERWVVEVQKVNGQPTYVLTSSRADSTKVRVTIDQTSFHLQAVHVERGNPAARDIVDIRVLGQMFDKPIPAETFVWKAPAGYTEMPSDGLAAPLK